MRSQPCLALLALIATAAPAGAADVLYVAEYKFNDPKVRSMDLSGGNVQTLALPPVADWLIVGLQVDVAAGKVYWTHGSINQGAIRRANLDGSQVQTIVSGLTNPRGLALDAPGGKVYWSDTQDRTIYRANLDGTNLQTVVGNGNQTGRPCLDLVNGKLYYGDLATGEIRRCNLDGTMNQLVYAGGDDPLAIALDLSASRLYYVDSQTLTNHVAAVNLDGTGFQVLVPFGLASSGLIDIAVDPAGGHVYWADEIGAAERGVWRADLNGANASRIYTSPSGWNAAALFLQLDTCASPAVSYGQGCPGSGGFTPALATGSCLAAGASFTLEVTGGLGGATAFVFAGVGPTSLPMAGGCQFLLTPVLPPLFGFPLAAGGPGAGTALLTTTVPAGVPSGLSLAIQVFVQDPNGAGGGFANTNGLQLTVQ